MNEPNREREIVLLSSWLSEWLHWNNQFSFVCNWHFFLFVCVEYICTYYISNKSYYHLNNFFHLQTPFLDTLPSHHIPSQNSVNRSTVMQVYRNCGFGSTQKKRPGHHHDLWTSFFSWSSWMMQCNSIWWS